MKKIRLNKEFYKKSAVSKAKEEFKEFDIIVKEDSNYFIVSSEDKTALLEFVNYVLALS